MGRSRILFATLVLSASNFMMHTFSVFHQLLLLYGLLIKPNCSKSVRNSEIPFWTKMSNLTNLSWFKPKNPMTSYFDASEIIVQRIQFVTNSYHLASHYFFCFLKGQSIALAQKVS